MFSENVKKYLINAGWYKGRNIDTTNVIKFMTQEGYKVSGKVESFLKEFEGLRISYLDKNGLPDILHFDCIKAIKDTFLDNVIYYSERLNNINLCVIGQGFDTYMTIMMDDDGAVFGGYDDYLYKFGNNEEEAIENICLWKNLIAIN
jgi:hypothetical protein